MMNVYMNLWKNIMIVEMIINIALTYIEKMCQSFDCRNTYQRRVRDQDSINFNQGLANQSEVGDLPLIPLFSYMLVKMERIFFRSVNLINPTVVSRVKNNLSLQQKWRPYREMICFTLFGWGSLVSFSLENLEANLLILQ